MARNDGVPGIDPQVETWATSAARADAINGYIDDHLADETMWRERFAAAFMVGEDDELVTDLAEYMASRSDWPSIWIEWARPYAVDRLAADDRRAGDDVEGWG